MHSHHVSIAQLVPQITICWVIKIHYFRGCKIKRKILSLTTPSPHFMSSWHWLMSTRRYSRCMSSSTSCGIWLDKTRITFCSTGELEMDSDQANSTDCATTRVPLSVWSRQTPITCLGATRLSLGPVLMVSSWRARESPLCSRCWTCRNQSRAVKQTLHWAPRRFKSSRFWKTKMKSTTMWTDCLALQEP